IKYLGIFLNLIGDERMAKSKTNIHELLGMPLQGFYVREMSEVYTVDIDGLKNKTIGFFKDNKIANAFRNQQTDASLFKVKKKIVLTNDEIAFVIGEPATLLDD